VPARGEPGTVPRRPAPRSAGPREAGPDGGEGGAVEERWLALEGPLDLETTLGPLRCRPGVDPTWRIGPDEALRASVTPDGPATLHVRRVAPGALRARAWGPGAGWAL